MHIRATALLRTQLCTVLNRQAFTTFVVIRTRTSPITIRMSAGPPLPARTVSRAPRRKPKQTPFKEREPPYDNFERPPQTHPPPPPQPYGRPKMPLPFHHPQPVAQPPIKDSAGPTGYYTEVGESEDHAAVQAYEEFGAVVREPAAPVELQMQMADLDADGSQNKSGGSEDDDSSGISSSDSSQQAVETAISMEQFSTNLDFDSYFHEHKGTRVIACYSRALKFTYNGTMLCCYNALLFAFGMILAIVWGTVSALVAFIHVWLVLPLLKINILFSKGCCLLLLEPLSLCIGVYLRTKRLNN